MLAITLASAALSAAAAEPVLLVTGNDYAPLAGEELPHGGRATELVRRVFEKMGRPVTVDFLPWPRGYQATLDGKYLATFPYVRMPERARKFLFSDPLFIVHFRVLVHQDAPIKEPVGLTGKKLCVPVGYALSQPVERILEDIGPERQKPRTMAQCLRMLERNRVDFVVITRRQARALLQEEIDDLERLEALQEVKVPAPLYLIVPRNLEGGRDLLDAFNQARGGCGRQAKCKPSRRILMVSHPDGGVRIGPQGM